MNQSNPERTGRAITMREIREALGHNVNPQPPVDRAAWVDGDPLLEAIARAVWEQCSTEGTSLVVDDPRNIAAVAASVARAAVRAETLRDAEEICDEAGAVYTSKSLNGEATGAYELMERFRRKAEEAETATPAVVALPAGRAARVAAALREHGMVHLGDQVPADEYDCCADAVLAVLPEPTDRAAGLREAAEVAESFDIDASPQAVAAEPRTAVEAHGTGTQQQVPQRAYPDCERCGDTGVDPERDGAEPCPECQQTNVPAPVETDEERADREATERDHARGDHTYCGITCETEMPTEHLRNFVIAKGYPGTRGALDELLRRARAEVAEQQAAAEAEQDDTVHACPGRWGGPDCRCFDAEPAPAEQQAAAADGEETEARRG